MAPITSNRAQIAKRRSSRMALNAPIGLSGQDIQKCPLTMPAKATFRKSRSVSFVTTASLIGHTLDAERAGAVLFQTSRDVAEDVVAAFTFGENSKLLLAWALQRSVECGIWVFGALISGMSDCRGAKYSQQ
jgi:hypothetical protein